MPAGHDPVSPPGAVAVVSRARQPQHTPVREYKTRLQGVQG